MTDSVDTADDRWRAAQAKEEAFWRRREVFAHQLERVAERYAPVIREVRDGMAERVRVLDVGSGPTCAARHVPAAVRMYLDPLMLQYREIYAGRLPEGGKVAAIGERIPAADATFDIVVSVNALDHMVDPDVVLQEVRRVLAPSGRFLLGIFTHPAAFAAARRFIDRFLPFAREDAHPYHFSVAGVRRLLERHFAVERSVLVSQPRRPPSAWVHREDWMFVCRRDGPRG